MKYEFLSFIDSKAIREYNKDRTFTPAEQAVIITHSFRKTLDEKIAALEYLYNTYSDDEFGDDSVGSPVWDRSIPFRTMLGDYISAMKKALDDLSMTEGYVYNAGHRSYEERDYTDLYFSDYKNAFEYLEKRRECLMGDSPDKIYSYRIARVKLDREKPTEDCYYFDSKLRLIYVDIAALGERGECHDKNISFYFVNIPVPFKSGELIKEFNTIRSIRKNKYYAAKGQYNDPERIAENIKNGNKINMYLSTYSHFSEDIVREKRGFYYLAHVFSLDCDYCDSEDIDRMDTKLKYLALALNENERYKVMNLLLDSSCYWHHDMFADNYVTEKLKNTLSERNNNT